MIDVAVKIVYNDYSIPWQEQEYHEERIDTFKFQFAWNFKNQGFQMSTILVVECEYYPENRKFKIISFSKNYRRSVDRTLEMSKEFVKEYLIK